MNHWVRKMLHYNRLYKLPQELKEIEVRDSDANLLCGMTHRIAKVQIQPK